MNPAPADPLPFAVVVIGVSAGGLQALTDLLSPLPADFPVPVAVVQHLGRDCPSMLASILDRRVTLRVQDASQGKSLRRGVVYIAPPDRHLRITARGTVSLSQGARVHFTRPAADPLFESAAAVFGTRAIAAVLTGRGSDGAAGIRAIKLAGGTTIAQLPSTCFCARMPEAAIGTGCVDFILTLPAIPPALVRLVMMNRGPEFLARLPAGAASPGPTASR